MDPKQFEQIIDPLVERRAKIVRKSWHALTVNEQRDASVVVNVRPQNRVCEICNTVVPNPRYVYIRTESNWQKRCGLCGIIRGYRRSG